MKLSPSSCTVKLMRTLNPNFASCHATNGSVWNMPEEESPLLSRLSRYFMRHFLPSAARRCVCCRACSLTSSRVARCVRFAAAVARHSTTMGTSLGLGQQGRKGRGDGRISRMCIGECSCSEHSPPTQVILVRENADTARSIA